MAGIRIKFDLRHFEQYFKNYITAVSFEPIIHVSWSFSSRHLHNMVESRLVQCITILVVKGHDLQMDD